MQAHDPIDILTSRFQDAMRAAFGDALPANSDPLISQSRNPKFGDFQANGAMALGKALGQPPREVASKIVEHLDVSDIAEPIDPKSGIAGPGFINIRLKGDSLSALLDAMDNPSLGVPAPAEPLTVVVDLCGVNLAKQMHVGHLRATVIGDALARLFERLGHHVVRQNHFGDWGLPIAMVTAAVKRDAEAGRLSLDDLTLDDLDAIYRHAKAVSTADRKGLEAARRFDLGPKVIAELEEQVGGAEEAAKAARDALIALQAGDEDVVRIWQRIADITLAECMRTCERLNANVTEAYTAGESTYRDELQGVVDDLLQRGVAEESRGAVIVRLDDFGIAEPLLVRKSDGGFLYATTDMAGVRRRVQKLGGDRLVYAVDARQSLHFRQVFAASTKAGYATRANGEVARLEHAAFGTVLGEDGKPFKTRSGENIKLTDLLDEAVTRAERTVAEKNPDLPPDERRHVAEAVGIGAIKYADLSSDRIKDYVFSFDRMLAFEGDTGPYLQYALVRVKSILRNAAERFDINADALTRTDGATDSPPPILIDEPAEKELALEILRHPGVIASAAEALEPHRLCGHLFSLATAFSAFFQHCPVLQAPDDETRLSRLRMCALTGRALESGLETLGIKALERM